MKRAPGVAERLQQVWLERGWLARMLWPLSALVGVCVRVRRLLLRRGWLRADVPTVPLIVVGNLIVGGAGKTPTVLALLDLLRRNGYSPGIVSRGYGRQAVGVHEVLPHDRVEQSGDEPLLLRIRGGAPTVVAESRSDAVDRLLRGHPEVDVVVSDDGLQHWRLHRDLQLIVFDERGAGNGWLLPAGPLREPLPSAQSLRRGVRSWVVYNAERPTTALPGTCVARALGFPVSLGDWWQGCHSGAVDWRHWNGKPLIAAAGIARPERFFTMLRANGLDFEPIALADHDPWRRLPWPASTPDAIVSEKDAVKLRPDAVGSTRVWVAPLDFHFDGQLERELTSALAAIVRSRRAHRPVSASA